VQPELEFTMPVAPQHSLYTINHEPLSKSEEYFSQMVELSPEGCASSTDENSKSLGAIIQESQTEKLQGLKRRQKPSSTIWHLILILGDVFLLLTALLLVPVLVPFVHLTFHVPNRALNIGEVKLIWICLAFVSWSLAVNMTHSQDLSFVSSRFKSPLCTLFALAFMVIFWIILSYLLIGIGFITSTWLGLFFLAFAIPMFTLWRVLLAEGINLPRFRRQAVIVGVNTAGKMLTKELQSAKHPSINVLGYIGADESVDEKPYQNELPILGGRGTLRSLVQNNIIDMIIVALDHGAHPELFKEATLAAQFGISVVPMAVVYESASGKIPVEHVSNQWYVALQSERIFSPFYLGWRKILDVASGLCGLLILCLVLPFVALLIYLDSPGPIFYSQERLGFHGKPFRMLKFRSMRTDAEGNGLAVWATAYDPRVTRIGRFLRTTHLDEFPQLLNILRGEMSLIGPRPERAAFITELEKTIPFYGYRLAAKPGLTGWAQVKYRYGRTDNDALIKLQYDLYYIKRQSFMLDIFILLKTVIEVLSLRGS
jgi:exopolysaccharide biosynthesis polyprenyl glycosylphosphotransferase